MNVRLAQLDDRLYELLARYQFYQDAIDIIIHQEHHYQPRCHFGLIARHCTLTHAADAVLSTLNEIRRWVKEV